LPRDADGHPIKGVERHPIVQDWEPLAPFHPLVRAWFTARVGTPTAVQARAGAAIARSEHVLATAPTGSGKTLAAFPCAIDAFARGALEPGRVRALREVVESRLKAGERDGIVATSSLALGIDIGAIDVEEVNGLPAAASPYRAVLATRFHVDGAPNGLRLSRRYG
jgi:Lhr-like helicase